MNRKSTHILNLLAGSLLVLGFAGSALANATPSPTLRAALDYSAHFSPDRDDWQVFHHDGRSLRVLADADCRNEQAPPEGLWLLTRNGAGQPELLAPSALPLPAGHSGHIALLACDAPAPVNDGGVLRVPSELMEWLTDNAGLVYVSR
ncbi:MAG: hypothetical protein CVV14_04950 [Gammaproteobacteria bacterium HGW-Gammaproteobacteria-4]|nr:MAG: hypothetical protein CVV14_04950 [Gammaproteobacteria bacterium HGW-Gammaproteobacteria-4]PKM09116.1 MAG: hypothetical protein CVV15_09075 [Gammaproteobacteria bacterium HGW-Gammaproteobacteria-5]